MHLNVPLLIVLAAAAAGVILNLSWVISDARRTARREKAKWDVEEDLD